MIEQIEHIGIVVEDLKKTLEIYKLLGLEVKDTEFNEDLKLRMAFLPIGNTNIELIEVQDPDLAYQRLLLDLSKKGIHHIAFKVKNLEESLKRLQESNVKLLKEPSEGAKGSRVAWLDPNDTDKAMIELVETSEQQ